MSEAGRILIIDDDAALLHLMDYNLQQEGYDVQTAVNGRDGLRAVFEKRPDLVILDVMMPAMDGFETCQRIRELTDVPIIMVTARHQEEDIVRGLELGADDYIIKPFRLSELNARVRAAMRRAQMAPVGTETPVSYQDNWLYINLPERIVEVNKERISLSATEFNLLSLLLRNAGRVLEFNDILAQVWGSEYVNEIAYVRVYVSHLRQKLEPDASNPIYIQTERQVGYRFVPANARDKYGLPDS
ncbi:MAG: response regulator transcription factor [Chloroflexi bacterium]|nr:response regulator transcription factor [Chloroflexota bacterium]